VDKKQRRILTYALYDFFLGLFLPIAATAAEFLSLNVRLTWPVLRAMHLNLPLMLVIDDTPLNLSASFVLIGIQSACFLETSTQLDEQLKTQVSTIENGITQFNTSTLDDGLYRPLSMLMGYAVVHEGESLEDGCKAADKAIVVEKTRKKAT
jgi:hypothetical protein